MASLSVFNGILKQPVTNAFYRLLWADDADDEEFLNAWGGFFGLLSGRECDADFARCIAEDVMYDENVFSRMSAAGKTGFSENMLAAVERDIEIVKEAASVTPADFFSDGNHGADVKTLRLPQWKSGETPYLLDGTPKACVKKLEEYYGGSGCGIFARHRAFIWRNREICPVLYPDETRLSDLKGYEMQRGTAVENTTAFLNGLPANNCLLYGDRGTGKSSTVKAILNEYYTKGLRMVGMPKESIPDFPLLVDKIAGIPMKFIIFIDDLSFSKEDDTYASLKAALEGGLAARPLNTLIYATSNRRHLVRESFADREGDEIHLNDTIQENLSLADRFGLAINFTLPDKDQYLEIVRKIAADRQLDVNGEELEKGAQAWAISRGGRSPRCAKQYVRTVEAKYKSGK
ncbi:MAG TPA: AAA+ family ATPase [Ruminococcaceae bacterium]|nr:AAA+ family ATPase [Oscillospiraceae bacterium]